MRKGLFFVLGMAGALAWSARGVAQGKIPAALEVMAETERSFSRTSVAKGVRQAFYEFFAEEGVNFRPHPERTREAIRKLPPQTERPPVTLEWEPVYGDIAAAEDLGYLTGPYLLSDHSPQKQLPQHGYYFSVWKRQADGTWRVVMDIGVQTPAPEAGAARSRFRRSGVGASKVPGKADAAGARTELLRIEGEFLKAATHHGLRDGYLGYLATESRLHRNGTLPLVGREAIRAHFEGRRAALTKWESIEAAAASSADLGYTYGSYELKDSTGGKEATEKGYFARVWKRDGTGTWKIVADISNPLPPQP